MHSQTVRGTALPPGRFALRCVNRAAVQPLAGSMPQYSRPQCSWGRRATKCKAQSQENTQLQQAPQQLVGEDAAVFQLEKQSLKSWALFGGLLTGVSALLYAVGGHCWAVALAG